ncbi:MAG: ECF-type sigma factor [Phycisphaerae bacterium]
MILHALTRGNASAAAQLFPLVYRDLRAVAASKLRNVRADHTLQATALVHESFLRLVQQTGAEWNGRGHFLAVAATAMRQILTDHARRRAAAKRGADWGRVTLSNVGVGDKPELDVLRLDELLQELCEADPRKHRVVELRFFGGLTVDEIAEVLGVSKSTVESDWRAARAWLAVELEK